MSIKSYKPKWPRRAYLGPAGEAQAKREAARKQQSATSKPKTRQKPAQRQSKAINPRSAKMAKLMTQYRKQRAAFLRLSPWCGVCHTAKATDVHHKLGRGPYLLMSSTWIGVCRICHNHIHAHPSWAYAEGLLIKRT
jgi:hypothetical protein